MKKVRFHVWFDHEWLCKKESLAAGIRRLMEDTGLAFSTIYWAYRGARTSPETAHILSEASGGKVDTWPMVSGPSRKEVQEAA